MLFKAYIQLLKLKEFSILALYFNSPEVLGHLVLIIHVLYDRLMTPK